MKMKSQDDEYVTAYIGTYGRFTLAVSKDLEPVKTYMTYHRELKPKEFEIKKERMKSSSYLAEYEDFILSDFYDFRIPSVDIRIIESEYGSLEELLSSTCSTLTYLAVLFNRTKKNKPVVDDITTIVRDFEKVSGDKKAAIKLLKYHMLSHPIIKCPIFDYLDMRLRYIESSVMNEEYRRVIAKKD